MHFSNALVTLTFFAGFLYAAWKLTRPEIIAEFAPRQGNP
jgi:hypothetical protein